MLRHLSILLFFILFLSSCQQRYGHVKKVKGDKNKSIQKEKPSPEKETETLAIVPTDTLSVALLPSEIPDHEPKGKALVPEKRSKSNPEKSGPQEELRQLRPFKDLFAYPTEDNPNDEPLTFKEKVFIFCVLFALFSLNLFNAGAILGVLILLIWLYGSLASTAALFTIIITSIVLILLIFFMSLYLGRKYINKKLNKSLKAKNLVLYQLLAAMLSIGAFILPAIVASAFIPALQIVFWTLLLLAGVYIVLWSFTN